MATVVSGHGPLLRSGIIAALREHGVDAVDHDSVDPDAVIDVLVKVVESPRDLVGVNGAPIIAVVHTDAPDVLIDTIRAGAMAALPTDAGSEALLAAHRAVEEGLGLLPGATLADLAGRTDDDRFVSDAEVRWLVDLAGGATVAAVARDAGYSERSLYRLLHGLYARLGAGNRYEAVAELRRRGLAPAE